MIREAIQKIHEETKISGHNIEVSKEQVLAFLKKKFGEVDVLDSFSVVGNMIKMLFVSGGHTTSYVTEIKWVIKNTDFDDGSGDDT